MYKELLYRGKGLKKKKVMHPRKEGWSGRAPIPGPSTPRGPLAPCPRAPPLCPPTNHASQQVPGQPRQGGREPAAHFGLEGESHRSMKAEWGVGTEDLPRPPAPTCHLPGQLGTSWPGPPDRPQEPASSSPPRASVTPGRGGAGGGQLGHKGQRQPGKTTGV